MPVKRILIVDDEETLCEVLKINLENEGFDVDIAFSAEQALSLDLPSYSLILLDIMLGETSGIKMAKILKSNVKTANIPIIFCTARDSEDDMIMGLDIGADDYIVKPYTVRNVIARVKSVLRRTSGNKESQLVPEKPRFLQVNGLQLNLEFKRCIVDGVEVKMAKKEFELLAYLILQRGKICSREEILSRVWSAEVVVLDRTIDVNITRLRSKIGPYGSYIVTRSGFGYGFSDKYCLS
jgi:two-component system phosphate regulon response regulator PhoB